jgi:hypothetical protein
MQVFEQEEMEKKHHGRLSIKSSQKTQSMLRASSKLAQHFTKQGGRKFSAAAAGESGAGSDVSWLLGATVAVLTAGAVVAVRSQHSVLLQQDLEWKNKVSQSSSNGRDDHHGKH